MGYYSIDPAFVRDITGTTVSQALIDAAENIVEEWAQKAWREVTVTDELYDGDGSGILLLKNYPLLGSGVTALAVWDDASDAWDDYSSDELGELKYDKQIGKVIDEYSVFI